MAVSLEFIWPNLLLSIHFTLVEATLAAKGPERKIDIHLPVSREERPQRLKELQQNSLFQTLARESGREHHHLFQTSLSSVKI